MAMDAFRVSTDELAAVLLKLAEAINAAVSYQEVLEVVAQVLPDCQGVYLNLWEHLDYDKATYVDIVAAASIAEELGQSVGQRLAKADFPIVGQSTRERILVIEDVQTDPRLDPVSRSSYQALGVQAYMRVSFHRDGHLAGGLFFKYSHPRQFSERERRMGLGIGDLVVAAVERIQSQQETAAAVEAQRIALLAEQEAREELSLLYAASEAVNAATTFPEVIKAIAPLTRHIEKVYLILWEYLDYRKASYFEIVAGITRHGEVPASVGKRHEEARYPIAQQMAKMRQMAVEDIHNHPLVDPVTRAGWEADGVQALLMVSLVQDERWYGVLSFENSTPRTYSERDRRLTLAISDLVLSAVIRIQAQEELADAAEAQRTAFLAEQAAREEMARLYQVSKAINQATAMPDVLRAAKQLFPDPVDVAIFAWEDYDRSDAGYLEVVVATDPNLPSGMRLSLELVAGPAALDPYQLLVINDVNSPEWGTHPASASARYFGLNSIACTNLMHDSRVLGLFAIASYKDYSFCSQEIRLMTAIADLTAAALERFRSRQAAEEARQEREDLFEASQAINAATSFQEILDAVAPMAFDGGAFYLYIYENFDYQRASYIETVATSATRFMTEGTRIPLEQLPFLKSHPRPGLWAYEDVANHPELDAVTKATMLSQGLKSNLRFGLSWRNRMLGAFGIDHATVKHYTPRERRMMRALGELISAAVERIRSQQETAQARHHAETLATLSKSIFQATDEHHIFAALVDVMAAHEAEQGTLGYSVYNNSNQMIGVRITAGWHKLMGYRYETDMPDAIYRVDDLALLKLITQQPDVPLFVEDMMTDKRLQVQAGRDLAIASGRNAHIIIPLHSNNRIHGTVSFVWPTAKLFPDDLRKLVFELQPLLTSVVTTRQAYRAVEQAHREIEQRARELQTVARVSATAATSHHETEVLQSFLELARTNFAPHQVGVYLLQGNWLVLWDRDPVSFDIEQRVPLQADHISARAARQKKEVIQNRMVTPSPSAANGQMPAVQQQSELAVPMVVNDKVVGILMFQAAGGHQFSESNTQVIITLADLMAVAIQNARYFQQAQELAALEERTRLARELHDSVSQALYGIGLGAQTAQRFLDTNPTLVRESVDYILTLAEAGLAEMRALIFELRPESLETEGLVVALAKQGASLQARHQINVQLELTDEPALALAAKESLYRVLREALHNVIKHASATQITLRMQYLDNHLRFEIIDNGCGFIVDQEFPGHLGLQSMRERVHQLGGQLIIQSAPGEGTHLTVTLLTPTYPVIYDPPKV